jgi:predicted PurR-regulated permease PerM
MADRAERRWLRTDAILLAAGLILLAYLLGDVLLLVFGAILIAVGLDGLARALAERTPLARGWALVAASVAILGIIVATFALVAPQFVRQFAEMQDVLLDFAAEARAWLTGLGIEEMIDGGEAAPDVSGMARELLGHLAGWGMTALGAITSLVILIVLAAFLAADPALYRRGLVRLVPHEYRPRAEETLSAIALALRWWFLGQLASMLLLGVTVGLGLFLLGIDLWLALAVVTALLTFIPFLGPLIAMIPIVIVGFAEGIEIGLIVTLGYLVIQNVEGNVIVPMIQHKAVDLAPALLISVQVLLSLVFGIVGLILAAPLTVVAMVAVEKLWIEAALGETAGDGGA